MPAVIAAPGLIGVAATDVATIGSTVNAAHMAAAAPTVAVIPAAADEVSASVAHLFSSYAQDIQGLAGKAAAFHDQFVQHLSASASAYARSEAANVLSLRPAGAVTGSGVGTAAATIDQAVSSLGTALGPQLPLILQVVEVAIVAVAVVAALIALAPLLPVLLPLLVPYISALYPFLLLYLTSVKM